MLSGGRSTAGVRLAGPSHWDGVGLGKRLSQGAQILRQGRVETLVEQTLERFVTAPRLNSKPGIAASRRGLICDGARAADHRQSPEVAVAERPGLRPAGYAAGDHFGYVFSVLGGDRGQAGKRFAIPSGEARHVADLEDSSCPSIVQSGRLAPLR